MLDYGLNLFQRLTRRWETIHPYNAAQVMRIGGRMDPGAATALWGEALRALGLGQVRVSDAGRFRHDAINGQLARFPVRLLPAGTSLDAHLTQELNRRFDDPEEPPFRPFLLPGADEFHFGVVYQHWIADSVSIRAVLQEWFTRTFDPSAARSKPLRQAREGYWNLFATHDRWRFDQAFLSGFRWHMRYRRARKVRTAGTGDYPVRVTTYDAPSGLIDGIRTCARGADAKVQDVLLAAMAEVCDQFVPTQRRKNRPDLAIGSILDLRRHAGVDLSETFGLFLGFSNIVCRRQHLDDWQQLLRAVTAQNRGHRRNGPAQASLMWMLGAMALDRFLRDDQLYHFYRKELPMLGGLSNVNLNDAWATRYHPEPLREYLRVSPTGPLVPLVFSTTTLGSKLSFALTCRNALLGPDGAAAMAGAFLRRLCEVAGNSHPCSVDNGRTK
ncbi:MAG TPA: hypothetical protein VGI81_26020 [Tepidisphaeraceae bacterium]|jgi:hypothetical protein